MTLPRITTINGHTALTYGHAWVVSSPGGRWTCLEPGCGETIDTPIQRGRTDDQRDSDRVRLHKFAKEHAHEREEGKKR